MAPLGCAVRHLRVCLQLAVGYWVASSPRNVSHQVVCRQPAEWQLVLQLVQLKQKLGVHNSHTIFQGLTDVLHRRGPAGWSARMVHHGASAHDRQVAGATQYRRARAYLVFQTSSPSAYATGWARVVHNSK